jgi:hypothetical protein
MNKRSKQEACTSLRHLSRRRLPLLQAMLAALRVPRSQILIPCRQCQKDIL